MSFDDAGLFHCIPANVFCRSHRFLIALCFLAIQLSMIVSRILYLPSFFHVRAIHHVAVRCYGFLYLLMSDLLCFCVFSYIGSFISRTNHPYTAI